MGTHWTTEFRPGTPAWYEVDGETLGGTEQCMKRGGGRYALVRRGTCFVRLDERFPNEQSAREAVERAVADNRESKETA